MVSYIIWNGSAEIFSLGSFALRWYGLLFALGFLISQQVLYYIYRQEGKPEKDVDTLTIYMVVATILGARLGHVIFYQPELFVTSPLSILLPFEFSPFRVTGFTGLASHGGAFGILFALWLYSRKKKPGQNYIQVLDRIVIVVALTGALIRLGNFFNSEIIGLPSNNPFSVVFINPITDGIMDSKKGTTRPNIFPLKKIHPCLKVQMGGCLSTSILFLRKVLARQKLPRFYKAM
jgi:phosphatidylglycerol---prolipoprotein diacylglyceryl transferase